MNNNNDNDNNDCLSPIQILDSSLKNQSENEPTTDDSDDFYDIYEQASKAKPLNPEQISNDFHSNAGTPVTSDDLSAYKNTRVYPIPGMNVSTNTLSGSMEIPETVEDIQSSNNPNLPAPIVYVVESQNTLNQEIGKDLIAGRINKRKKSTAFKTKIIARMFLNCVKKIESLYQISGVYRTAQNQLQNFSFTLDSKKYQNKYHQAFIDNGVDCFNEKISPKSLSRYMKMLIQKKEVTIQSSAKHGFFLNDDICNYICVETCQAYNFPQLTDKHFIFEQVFMPDVISGNFYDLIVNHENPSLFLLLNVIRIASLYSTLLNNRNAAFCKVVVIKGDYNKISPYLQIYNRMIEKDKELSVNMKPETALNLMEKYKDDVFLLNDEIYATDYKRKNGEETIKRIADKVAGYNPETDFSEMCKYPYTVCVVSDRLSNVLNEKSAMLIDASSLTNTLAITSEEVYRMHSFDRLMVNYAVSNYIYDKSKKYNNIYEKSYKNNLSFKSSNSKYIYCVCMEIFKQISSIINANCEKTLNQEMFSEYLTYILLNSEANYSSNTIEANLKKTINRLILSENPDEKIELVFHSKLTNCYGETKQYPVIYRKDNKLLIHDEVFKFIVSKMIGSNNDLAVRKHLKECGLLYYTENLKSKERLFGKKYSGDIWLTVLSDSVLSDEAKNATVGGVQNYTACVFSEEQIFIGYDKKKCKIGLSLDEHFRRGFNIVGKNLSYTNILADLIALQLAEKNEIVFFIDYCGSTISDNMRKYGFDETVIENLIYESADITDIKFDSDIQEIYLENDSRRIFSFCGNNIEMQLECFLELKNTVKNKDVFLILHNAGDFERKINKPFHSLMKDCERLHISPINIYNGSGELRGRYNNLINKSDVKFFFTEDSAKDAEFAAEQNYLKPSKEFGELIYKQSENKFIMTGCLEDIDSNKSKGSFIQLELPTNEEIVQLFSHE